MALKATLGWGLAYQSSPNLKIVLAKPTYDDPILISPRRALMIPVRAIVQRGMAQRESTYRDG